MHNTDNHTMRNFFRYMGVGFVIICIKTKIQDRNVVLVLKDLFDTFTYCFTAAVWIGLSGMFTTDLYYYIKKNSMTEKKYKLCLNSLKIYQT